MARAATHSLTDRMAWIPGGTFAMGDTRFYPEERPVREVEVDGFWIDECLVTAAEFRRFVRETGHVTVAERPPDSADYPDADPELLVPGLARVPGSARPVDLSRRHAVVGIRPGRELAAARRARQHDQRTRPAPGGARRLRRCGGVRLVGGQGAADGGGMGIRGARRSGRRRLRLGRRALSGRKGRREHVAGRVSRGRT